MPNWSEYLDRFHAERPGVTEAVLTRCVAGHHNPYAWLARAVSGRANLVLDVGCGSGAMTRELKRPDRVIIGLDLSDAEIARATASGEGPWVVGDGRALPFADNSVDAVTSTLGLAVIHPTHEFLDEVARVLKPGGLLAVMTPTVRPLNFKDIATATILAQHLRTPPQWPVPLEFTIGPMLATAGLRKLEDARERYRFTVRSRADADLLLSALYLPNSTKTRVESAASWLEEQVLAHGQVDVPIPIRRILAIK
ncbi:MAG TPA: class I SAM-dependent methyltransferase [Propionibacteriaceae bacterium]|nr:class I SAM-dependent methyltransferase [Propionibacteriaceae bacterium]